VVRLILGAVAVAAALAVTWDGLNDKDENV